MNKYYAIINNTINNNININSENDKVYILVTKNNGLYNLPSFNIKIIGYTFSRDAELEEFYEKYKLKDTINLFRNKKENKVKQEIPSINIDEVSYLDDISSENEIYIQFKCNINLIGYICKQTPNLQKVDLKELNSQNSSASLYKCVLSLNNIETNTLQEDDELLNFINPIIDAQRYNNLVVFLGAGFSKNYGYPLWNEIIDDMRKSFKISPEIDYLKTSQLVLDKLDKSEFYKYLDKWFDISPLQSNCDLATLILKLNPCHIITSNYDSVLENSSSNIKYNSISSDSDFSKIKYSNYIIKMHGDYSKRNIVLTEDDYLSYKFNFPLIRNQIISLFTTKTFLFLGFKYDDINLKYILNEIGQHLKNDHPKINIFFTSEVDNTHDFYLKKRKFKTYYYNQSIEKYLTTLLPSNKDILQNNNNSNGQELKLSNFLKLLVKLKSNFAETIVNDSIESIEFLIKKYNHIPSFSPFVLENYRPFQKYNYDASEINQNNRFIIQNAKLNIYGDNLWNLFKSKNDQPKEIKKKIENILYKLHISGVFQIKKYQTTNSANTLSTYIKTNNYDDYLNKFKKGNFVDVLENCNLISLSPEDFSITDINEASFILFHNGFHLKSIILLKHLIKQYKYYNDNYNLLRVVNIAYSSRRLAISDYEEHNNSEEIKNILSNIYDLKNDEDIIFQNLDVFEKINFKDVILQNKYSRYKNEINNAYEELVKIYEKYKNSEFKHYGPNYAGICYKVYAMLHYMYSANYLYDDYYKDKKDPILKFICSQIIVNSIDDKYEYKSKKGLDLFTVETLIFKIIPDDFINWHNSFDKLRFSISDEGIKYLSDFIYNFKISGINSELNEPEISTKLQSLLDKHFLFNQTFRYIFDNIIYLLSYTVNEKPEFRDLIKDINYLLIAFVKSGIIFNDICLGAFAYIQIKHNIFIEFAESMTKSNKRNQLTIWEIVEDYIDEEEVNLCNLLYKEKPNFIFNYFDTFKSEFQDSICKILLANNISFERLTEFIEIEHIKNLYLKEFIFFIYNKENKFFKYVDKIILNGEVSSYKNDRYFYLDRNINVIINICQINKTVLKKVLNNNSHQFFIFFLNPNKSNYQYINENWLFNYYSIKNIAILNKKTCLEWLKIIGKIQRNKEIENTRLFNILANRLAEFQ